MHRIREIEEGSRDEEVERLFADLMTRAAIIEDGTAWFVIEEQQQK